MTYADECQAGRDHAAHVMREVVETGNMPKMVRAIRDAAKDKTGYGVGFLFTIGAEVAK